MNMSVPTAVSVALMFLAQSALACNYPERVEGIPDGAKADRDAMIAAKNLVQSYIADMESYLSCIEAEEAQAQISMSEEDEDAKRQRLAMFDKKYNAAVEQMNLVAEEFNVQLRAYNASN